MPSRLKEQPSPRVVQLTGLAPTAMWRRGVEHKARAHGSFAVRLQPCPRRRCAQEPPKLGGCVEVKQLRVLIDVAVGEFFEEDDAVFRDDEHIVVAVTVPPHGTDESDWSA